MAAIDVRVRRKHHVEVGKERGRGGAGGWVWRARCRCGWRGMCREETNCYEEAEGHLNDEQVMVDVLDDAGSIDVIMLTFWWDSNLKTPRWRASGRRMGRDRLAS